MKKYIKLINLLLFGLLVSLSSCNEGMCKKGMHLQCFNLDSNGLQPINLSNVYGCIGFYIENIPQDVNEILIYVEDVEIDKWVRSLDTEHKLLGFDSDNFSNGPHKIRLKSIKADGGEEYLIIDSKFNNLIFNTPSNSDEFYPLEDYHYSGFNRDGNPLEVKLVNNNGKELWSNTCSGRDVNVVIPGAAFRDEQLCKLLITDTVTGKNCAKNLYIDWKNEDFMGN